MKNAYEILHVPQDADDALIAARYRDWQNRAGDDPNFMKTITEAFELINTAEKRAVHNAQLAEEAKNVKKVVVPSFALVSGYRDPTKAIKVVLVGDDNEAKNEFKKSLGVATGNIFGIDFALCTDERTRNRYQIWDMPGQERHRSVSESYLKNAKIVLFFPSEKLQSRMSEVRAYMLEQDFEVPREVSMAYMMENEDPFICLHNAAVRLHRAPAANVVAAASSSVATSESKSFVNRLKFWNRPVQISEPNNFALVSSFVSNSKFAEVTPGQAVSSSSSAVKAPDKVTPGAVASSSSTASTSMKSAPASEVTPVAAASSTASMSVRAPDGSPPDVLVFPDVPPPSYEELERMPPPPAPSHAPVSIEAAPPAPQHEPFDDLNEEPRERVRLTG